MDQDTFNSTDMTGYNKIIKVHAKSYITKLDSKIRKHLLSIKLSNKYTLTPNFAL